MPQYKVNVLGIYNFALAFKSELVNQDYQSYSIYMNDACNLKMGADKTIYWLGFIK